LLYILTLASTVSAHHGASAHFDPNDLVTIEGVITEIRFVNPHSFVHMDVDNAGVVMSWRCELSGIGQLTRRGWTHDTLTVGLKIKLVGERARRESNACAMKSITLTDGDVIESDTNIVGADIPETIAGSIKAGSRQRYLDNGQPNIAGTWVSRSGGGTGGELTNGPAEPTEAGLAASEAFDFRFDNPVIHCNSGNIIYDWYRQSHVNDIQQDEYKIILRYGYLDLVRTIHLGMTSHPDNLLPSVGGHSIGRWEDDVLVVDTIGLSPGALLAREEVMISNQVHIVERFYYDRQARILVREFTVTDPLYLKKPYSGRNVSDIAAKPYQLFNCIDLSGENNLRPGEHSRE
jgi:hypothetical protein